MNPVEQVIWLIESRLADRLSDAEIVRETGLSRFVTGRQFQTATGLRVADYARARRLSEAAKRLARTDDSVTAIALGAAYASPEAFTRAFRRQFGITPHDLRRSRDLATLELQEPLRMTAPIRNPLTGPVLVQQPAMTLVGLERRYDADPVAGIPGQWQELLPYLAHLAPTTVGAAYGIVRNAAPNAGAVTYLAAIRAGLGLEPGKGLVGLKLPAMRLAQFAMRGHISAIMAATQEIFREHLPRAGLRPAGAIDLIEVYGPQFDPQTGFGEVGLWVPVAV